MVAAALWRLGYLIDSKTRLAPKQTATTQKFNQIAENQKSVLIGIGSLLAGGAGKTPYTAFLAEKFNELGLKVAIICKNTGDENLWYAKKKITVFTTSFFNGRLSLYHSIKNKFDIILLDDGLEDRRLYDAFWICLTWGERAEKISDLIPAGKCRSLWKDHPEISCIKRCAMEGDSNAENADIIFFTDAPKNFLGETLKDSSKITAIAGIARPERFFNELGKKYNIAKKIALPDHSKNIKKNVKCSLQKKMQKELPIVITEKDAIKLPKNILQNKNLYVAELKVKIAGSRLK